MKKTLVLLILALTLTSLAGCRLNLYRLNKRLDKWNSMKNKQSVSVEKKVRFARESITFFLTTLDLQRSREALVTEAERLTYHRKMSGMQVFLIDYHAGLALSYAGQNPPDWERALAEYTVADSITYGKIPGLETVYVLVHLQRGYAKFIREIAANGDLYQRMERDFPGLMEAFRKLSRFQFKYAGHLLDQGRREEALEAYLKVFVRDPGNYARAEEVIKNLTGRTLREIYDRQFWAERSADGFYRTRLEMFDMCSNVAANIEAQDGPEAVEEKLTEGLAQLSENFQVAPEQLADIYYYTLHERQGTLPQYVLLWRTTVLKGHPPLQPTLVF